MKRTGKRHRFEDHYLGEWDSIKAYAEEMLCETAATSLQSAIGSAHPPAGPAAEWISALFRRREARMPTAHEPHDSGPRGRRGLAISAPSSRLFIR